MSDYKITLLHPLRKIIDLCMDEKYLFDHLKSVARAFVIYFFSYIFSRYNEEKGLL
jgi:hypothetical protein